MLTIRSVAVPVAALVAAAGLAGCGSDDPKGAKSAKPSATATSTAPASYLPVPDGVTLTAPGTQLGLGEEGVVAFERRQGEVGVLAVDVQRIERTSFQKSFAGWNVDAATAARTPYFVRVKVTNVGDVDLGGLRLDSVLWGDDGTTLEAPNYYKPRQLPVCSGEPLPTPFAADATAELCQVYFIAPSRSLENVSFPPFGGLDPVTWSGELSPVLKPGKKDKSAKPGQQASESTSSSATASPSGTADGSS
ncbi:hypothetical protein [Nocardioides daeguensis]|uniref:DUF4352 domain-containing protein n=1 Tax=Nocardioides daeguensis TaxID=908359 RepID=A0ABP6VPK5_9ACTN|nr:hypothetical protein [Nocardioides daeguensis]MBV6727472.1 hypothetical protein [Nocardioides daeguensis]MCR1773306.1 hypothetical protein [Nocardioides daeguensis]